MVNSSRMFATQATTYIGPADAEAARRLVRRHAAYVHALRALLRQQDPFEDSDFLSHLPAEEVESLRGASNLTHALLQRNQRELVALSERGVIDAFRLQSFDRTIASFLDIQGGCERIKKTPLPRGYAFIAETLIQYFSLLFPWSMVSELGLLVIPANVLVCLSFTLISEAGRVLEDPFNMFFNGLPLSQLSRMIEINMRETLGETDLPPALHPDERGVLM